MQIFKYVNFFLLLKRLPQALEEYITAIQKNIKEKRVNLFSSSLWYLRKLMATPLLLKFLNRIMFNFNLLHCINLKYIRIIISLIQLNFCCKKLYIYWALSVQKVLSAIQRFSLLHIFKATKRFEVTLSY